MPTAARVGRTVLNLLIAASFAAPARAAPPADGAFGGFASVPADARLAVRVRDARALRADARLGPLRDALQSLLSSRTLSESWARLAGQLGMDATSLGDQLLGLDVVYAERPGPEATEWAIATRVDPRVHALLVERLQPAAGSGGLAAFAEHRAVAAWRPPYLVVGPIGRTGLLDDMVRAFDAAADAGTLASLPPVALLRTGAAAPIELVWRQDGGGVGSMQARTGDRGVELQFRGSGDAWPLRLSAGWPVDPAWCADLARGSALATVGNAWTGPAELAGPVDRLLAAGTVDDAMRANLGARTAFVVGAAPRVAAGGGVPIPEAAVAIEVRDARLAWSQWRAWAGRLGADLAGRAGRAAPPVRTVAPARAAVDLRDVLAKVFDGHPFAGCGALEVEVVCGPGGNWVLVSTGTDAHARMRRSLPSAAAARTGSVHECGEAAGTAIARMLEAWAGDAARFARESPAEFADGASMAARLAGAIERARWRMRRVDEGLVEGTCVLEVVRP